MEHSFLNLLGSALVPELGADIAAGTSCHIQRILIPVAAVRAFPFQLAVLSSHDLNLAFITAVLAVIALCVQLRIHNVVINKADHLKNCRNIVLHIRNFHVADCSACGKRLEL